MFHVEFVGVPGSGKSTIRDALIERLQKVDANQFLKIEDAFFLVSKEKTDKIYRWMINLLPLSLGYKVVDKLFNRTLMQFEAQNRFLAKYGKGLNAFLSSRAYDQLDATDRSNVLTAFIETGSLYEMTQGEIDSNTAVFFEEGLVQKSFMFISHLRKREENNLPLHAYLQHIPLPDVIINVKADFAVCYNRMKERPKGLTKRLKNSNEDVILNFLKRSDAHLIEVTNWLAHHSNTLIIEVLNVEDLDDVINDLEAKIKTTMPF